MQYVETQVGSNRALALTCPAPGCGQPADADLHRRLPLREATQRLLDRVRYTGMAGWAFGASSFR